VTEQPDLVAARAGHRRTDRGRRLIEPDRTVTYANAAALAMHDATDW
jgi:hypothetical protein